MNEKNNFALVRKPSSAVEKAAPGAKRILSGMVADMLTVANAELENWYRMGEKYYYGQGVPQDYVEAVKWFRKVAEQNHAKAQFALGCCYECGDGMERNYAKAVNWYRKAAGQNYAEAQYALGRYYARVTSVERNSVEAVNWYRKAAEQGNAEAQYRLGECYEWGGGVEKDAAEAEKWRSKAREKWRNEAEEETSNADANIIYQEYHVQKARSNYDHARRLLRKAALKGHKDAMYDYAMEFNETYADNARFDYWLRKAANQGQTDAQILFGFVCRGRLKDLPEAYKLFKLATQKHSGGRHFLTLVSSDMTPSQLEEGERRYQEFQSSKK